MPRYVWRAAANLRRRLYEVLEHGTIGDRTGLIVGRLIVVLIIVNLVAITLESVPTFRVEFEPLFTAVEILSLVVFTIEYGLRVWVAVEHAPHRHLSARKARWGDAPRRKRHASDRAQCATGQIRHYPGCDVVGNRYAGHYRLR
jgi:hypothetical protein